MDPLSVRKVIQGESPILRQPCEPVRVFDEVLGELLQDLTDTMRAEYGVGLSAPQIGVSKAVLVADIGQGVMELINPEIVKSSGSQISVESCISFPGITLQLMRPQTITVRADNRKGKPFTMEATGLLARVLCHEIDHLNGILFFDHLDEEYFLSQFLQLGTGTLGLASDPRDSDSGGSLVESADLDLQLAIDMLADASWKLELATGLLKAMKRPWNGPLDVDRLVKISNKLAKETTKWDRFHLSQSKN